MWTLKFNLDNTRITKKLRQANHWEMVMETVKKLFGAVLNANRLIKRTVQAAFDSVIIFLTLCIAMAVRLESLSFLSDLNFYLAFSVTLVPTIYVFAYFGLYRAFLRHVSTEVTVIIGIGALISATILLSTRLI